MDTESKIKRYKEIFKDDPLYLKLENMNLLDELFKPCLLFDRVFFDATYSSKQSAELLEIPGKEQTLLNFLNRDDFAEYITIHRAGARGYYRYDYITLFQFKMILLLSDLKLTPTDIANLTGIRMEQLYTDRVQRRRPAAVNDTRNLPSAEVEELVQNQVNERANELFTAFLQRMQQIEESKSKKDSLEKKKLEVENDLKVWETEMKALIGRIEDIETYSSLYSTLNDSLKKSKAKGETGFLSKFFSKSKKDTEETGDDEAVIQSSIDSLNKRHQKLIEIKKAKEAEKETFIQQLNELKQQLSLENKKDNIEKIEGGSSSQNQS